MIDPRTAAVPVLPAVRAAVLNAPSATARPPRYLTVLRPSGLKAVVRIDGKPLGSVPERPDRAPEPLPEAMGLRLFAAGELDRVWAAAQRRRMIVTPAVRPPDAPVFTADEVRALRTRAGLSQRDLAAELWCSRGTVAGWENGRRVPQPDGARALAAWRLRTGA